ncbi:hypothetical protein HPB48_024578 [Haemaphysalis longicornis]|uniref:Kelch-like protein diablo n=1 Tax=Haemaphysalis longicornis TaxID=44386 RepID=A0A9J6GY82_HAELO|nr:hypothetical protein HPB48_024578 [Haemaphysalis longicornis]
MKAAGDGAGQVDTRNDGDTVTASALQLFSDGCVLSKYSPAAVARCMPMLRALRQAGQYCDVKLRTSDGGTLLAHRFVLADRYAGCGALFTAMCEAADISDLLVSDLSSQMLKLVIDLAYHVPLHEHVGTHNVLEVLQLAETNKISAVRDHCIKLLRENLQPGNCVDVYQLAVRKGYSPLKNEAFRYILQNFEELWPTSPQFQSLTFGQLWNVLHDDELHVTNEVEGCFGAIVKWIAGDAEARKGLLFGLLPLVRFSCGSNADMQKVEDDPLVRNDEKALGVLRVIKQTLGNEPFDSGEWGCQPHLTDRCWLKPRIPKDIIFMFGGWTRGFTNNLLTYNCRSRRWALHPNQCTPPRAYHGVAMLDGLLYFIGGFDGRNCYHSVVCLEVKEKKWSARSNMNVARSYISVALLGKYIYALGGFDGEGRTSSCERYDASRNQWDFVASMNEIRSDASAVAVAGRIYIMGGFTGLAVLDTAEYYDPSCDAWTRIVSMSSPRSGFKAVVDGDDVYVMGGFDGYHRIGSAERLDVRKGRWSQLPSMSFPRSNYAAALLERSIYVIGGFGGTSTVSFVERYDIESREWHRAADIGITCSAAASIVYHDVPNARRWI